MRVQGALLYAVQFAALMLESKAQVPVPGMDSACLQQLCDVYKSIMTCPVSYVARTIM